jgi:hypothetical protein
MSPYPFSFFKGLYLAHLHFLAKVFALGRPEQVQEEECANNCFVLTKMKWANVWFFCLNDL